MNRIQFYTLNFLGVVFIILVGIHFVGAHRLTYAQGQSIQAQQKISQANIFTNDLKQLAFRVVEVYQKTQDTGLKDFMTRQQIVMHAPPSNGSGAAPGEAAPSALTPPAAPESPSPLEPPLNH